MVQSSALSRLMALVVLGVSASGCEVIGGIFKAGVGVGALAVILIVVGVAFVVAKART
jgi:hypothetical protein